MTLALATGVGGFLAVGVPASAADATGSISGNVKAAGSPAVNLSGAWVHAYSPDGESDAGAHTDANGNYTIAGLAPGAHLLVFSKFGAGPLEKSYLPQWWDNADDESDAKPIQVLSGANVAAKNAVLSRSSSITGVVTDAGGAPLADLHVPVWKKVGDRWDQHFYGFTDENGRYLITGLTDGEYKLGFSDTGFADDSESPVLLGGTVFDPQFYPGRTSLATADTIIIASGGSTITNATVKLQGGASTASPVVDRFAGADRYATAVEISKRSFTAPVSVVYIASGQSFPDALAAAPAAAAQKGPLLLTAPNALPSTLKTELQRLKPQKIVVVGGTGAVSANVYSQLSTLAPEIRRDAGADRYETSRVIVQRAFGSAVFNTVFVATARDFPDALAASASAGAIGAPVVLVDGKGATIDSKTKALLTSLTATKAVIAGGTGSVSTGVESSLKSIFGTANVTRLGGIDRYATAGLINRASFVQSDSVYLASGIGFADALAGAAVAGKNKAPLYTVRTTCIPAHVLADIKTMRATTVVLLGGTASLSSSVKSLTACP